MASPLVAEQFNHSKIPVNDMETSRKFYVEKLGMKLMDRPGGSLPMPEGYVDPLPGLLGVADTPQLRLECGGVEVTLFQRAKPVHRKSTEEDGWAHYSYRMNWDRLNEICDNIEDLRNEGYDIPFAPIRMSEAFGWTIRLYIFDPNGYLLELVGVKG